MVTHRKRERESVYAWRAGMLIGVVLIKSLAILHNSVNAQHIYLKMKNNVPQLSIKSNIALNHDDTP